MHKVAELRTALWHLRSGGLGQVKIWRRRLRAEAGFRTPDNIRGAEACWSGRGKKKRLSFAPVALPVRIPRRKDITAAVILDDFSDVALRYEWQQVRLTLEDWRSQLSAQSVDLLFVESAWSGNGGAWKYQLTGASGPKTQFSELVSWCRDKGIPTVFWNKEDPPHYGDFLPAARMFDHVFTSDVNRLADYKRDLGHANIGVLPFAAQPTVHNPIRPRHGWHFRDVAFAGMYFAHKYPERRVQMDMILGGAMMASPRLATGLEIFSRELGGDPNYQFPAPLSSAVVGSLTYLQMLTAYKAYKVFLNVNSVVESPSMCARRIFEITASGTPVITTHSAAVSTFFADDEVMVTETAEQTGHLLQALIKSPELNDRVVHKAQRRIWDENTYAHRAEAVIAMALPGRSHPVRTPTVSALVSTIRPHQLDSIFAAIASQRNVEVELVLLTHGFVLEQSELDHLMKRHDVDSVCLLSAAASTPLGECLNLCARASSGEVLTKMDDDDYYGPSYIRDQLHALKFSDSTIVGKQAHYMYLARRNITILRFPHKEHRFTRMIMGPTIMGNRQVFLDVPFRSLGSGEDSAFLEDIISAAGTIYSADRFNYFQERSGLDHTWKISDDELVASGQVRFFGRPEEHVTI
ncbi:glycosyltransferase [Paeniglutamicibacter antarcticus]|uniref:Glycosyltransferase n=1 Tax=Arthrobacter terrae TaxID=2935737 RepID=A0A931G9Y2_9MICC|nr:glycosyltransferase [Arthrobacter terrae]MBG0739167.1 glycosyltransferase [Arthrobacter terrae]